MGKSGIKAKSSGPDSGSAGNSRRGRIDASGYTMAQLAMKLSEVVHRPVADATELAGKFDFQLEWTPDDMQARPAPDGAPGPSIFAALQEQMGLRLEARKVPAEVLVIDSAERPSEN